jgi:hypothetical protein
MFSFLFSSPAPGFFNDDAIPDLMMHWNTGTWPDYNQSQVIISAMHFVFGFDSEILLPGRHN